MHLGPAELDDVLARAGLAGGRLVTVSGGSLPAFRLVRDGHASLFIKVLPHRDMADAEMDGLHALEGNAFRVPAAQVVACNGGALLVQEWLGLDPVGVADERRFGSALAQLHLPLDKRPGWHRANWIGTNRQYNEPHDSWVAFFAGQRLSPQLEWARAAGLPARCAGQVTQVIAELARWLPDSPDIALLHGDLWLGNRACCAGQPALFDPAVYYGDPLVDVAMLHLFGAPGDGFLAGYSAQRPFPSAEFERRRPVYDLYHWLNHFTMFGGAYLQAVQRCCNTLLGDAYG